MATDDRMMISSTSKPTHMDSGKSIPTPASDRSTDQPDSAGDLDQEDVYVEVTILAKKVGKTGNTIQLKQFLVWKYYEAGQDTTRQFFMQHVKSSSEIVELGICERGPFGRVSIGEPSECRIIDINGPDEDFTMSNTFSELYLRARKRQKDVVARAQPNANSNFSLRIIGFSPRGAAICVINLISNPKLAFKYDNGNDRVIIDTCDETDLSFQFEFTPRNPTCVNFVDYYCAN